ncbi:hypothetical protein, partial [Pseudomonas syringae group genomosp. 7]|uniref:hypothetical protein n=1 Tax=Pseudomonas syringae group genomosp. 7 TaxID=251699 RepID=UPI00376FD5B1
MVVHYGGGEQAKNNEEEFVRLSGDGANFFVSRCAGGLAVYKSMSLGMTFGGEHVSLAGVFT